MCQPLPWFEFSIVQPLVLRKLINFAFCKTSANSTLFMISATIYLLVEVTKKEDECLSFLQNV